ncbi:MAG TPA: histidine--tRNA ligase [Candidatus Acidoferrum sp.]|nr:histidine--tRNA ligase [Candidatus Acidoferrum sp.]
MQKIQAIRGMNDVLPAEAPRWQYVEQIARDLFACHGYQEIRFPVLEQTELFKRSIGEVTDIVEKEMYTFEDRNGDSLTLRPEGTACCVRAAEQGGLLYNQTQKLWYFGPMYRHERPQKGRYRQFFQFGLECFGMAGSDIEGEVLLLCVELWRKLGIAEFVQLELNNIGSSADRARFGAALRDFLLPLKDQLDEDSQRRLDSNVLRVLDSKVPTTRALLANAPTLDQFVDDDSRRQFGEVLQLLDAAGIRYTLNPSLVRGLDYYNGLVFEWTTDKLGSQATVCGGGRYDNLVKQLGGSPTPAVGFGMGVERLLLLLEATERFPADLGKNVDVYLALVGQGVQSQGLLLARDLRRSLPSLRILTHCGGGKYNAQLKKAFASGARCAVILEGDGPQQQAKIKTLDADGSGSTQELPVNSLAAELARIFSKH